LWLTDLMFSQFAEESIFVECGSMFWVSISRCFQYEGATLLWNTANCSSKHAIHILDDLKLQFYLVLYPPGNWVLLDEINLASAETLECLSGLLEGSTGSVYLLERGDQKPIERHPDFRLFACMNPATDVGKKDLPAGLRNRFVWCLCTCLGKKGKLDSSGKHILPAVYYC